MEYFDWKRLVAVTTKKAGIAGSLRGDGDCPEVLEKPAADVFNHCSSQVGCYS